MNSETREHNQKLLNKYMQIVDEKIVNGPPYNFSEPLAVCISMIEGAPELGIELLKKMAKTGHEKSLVLLGEIYMDGKIHIRDGILAVKNQELGKKYLMKAVELGSTYAMLLLMGEHYIEGGVLKYREPENALYWLKRAADAGCETASEGWADHLADGKNATVCTKQEIDEIERYYQGSHHTSIYYKLARFHSDGISSKDYSSDEYSRARYWLNMGAQDTSCDREPCVELMREWGIEQNSKKESISNGMFIIQIVAGGIGLIFYAILGPILQSAAGAIMSVTVPACIAGYILYKLYGVFFSKN